MNILKPRILTRSISALLAVGAIHHQALALNGTWTNLNGGSWGTTGNWAGGTIASGIDTIADFSTLNITAARTVTLDGARTVGTLKFGDATTANFDWTLNTGTAGPLTLDVSSGFGTINVVNRSVTIGAVLAGSDGINVTGNPTGTSGTVILNAANTFTGGLRISGAVTQLNNATGAGANTITIATATNAASANRLAINGGVTIANNIVVESGASPLAGFGAVQQVGTGLATVNGTITINGNAANGGHFVGGTAAGNELVLNGAVSFAGGNVTQRAGRVIYKGGGNYSSLTFTGSAIVGANNGIVPTAGVVIGSVTTGTLELGAFNQAVGSLNFAGGGTGTVTSTTGTLTLNGGLTSAGNFTHALDGLVNLGGGTRTFNIGNGNNELDLTGAATISNGGITKTGAGTLALNGTIGATTNVTAGTLGGTGTYTDSLTIDTGAALAPATSGTTGTLTASTLAFGAGATSVRMKIGTGGDAITSTTLTTAGGTTTFDLNQIGGILPNGIYPLISYSGTSPGLAGFAVNPVGHALFTTIDTGTAIAIDITGNDRVIWDGTNTTAWATGGTGNWKLQSDASQTDFITADEVIFQDAPTSSFVDIAANVSPSKVNFTNTVATPYTVTGTAGIVGLTAFSKTGDGLVTLITPNSYTGATTVGAGTLELDHDATGNVVLSGTSGVSVATGATLQLTRDDGAFTFNRAISGSGTVEVNPHSLPGGGVAHSVNLSGNNVGFNGTLRLLSPSTGTYRITSATPANLGAASIEVQNGAQLFTATTQTYTNSITISGTGFQDSGGFIGALRLESNVVWAGPITVDVGGARIGAHNTTATVSGNISGGDLNVNGSDGNFNNNYTIIFTGTNSYGMTTIGGGSSATAVSSRRLNIGNGGTTGTLGLGVVEITGDAQNGVLGFDRSDSYTLLPGQTITGVGSQPTRVFVDIDTLGAGFNDNGNAITLGAAGIGTGGSFRVAQGRANAIANISGALTAERIVVSQGLAGGVLNFGSGAIVNANFLSAGEVANGSGTINQSPGSAVAVVGQLRLGHFGTLTATYNMNGGSLSMTGDSPFFTPSTAGAGAASATGDNNINALPTAAIVGGGIYLGIDGTGIMNHTGGTVTTNWIVLDNRGATGAGANMPDGIDRYNLSGVSSVLNLKSTWGLIGRNEGSYAVSFGGGTVMVDNSGTGTGTGADITIPLDATIDTVTATTTVMDTNGATNGFTFMKDVRGTGTLNFSGGGTINLETNNFQNITPSFSGSASINKAGTGLSNLSGSGAAYTGAITVSAGVLNVPNDLSATSTIAIADLAALAGEPTVASATIGSSFGAGLYFNPNTAGALTAGTLAVDGADNVLNLTATPAGAGPWTAINYTTKTGVGAFSLADAASYRSAPVISDTGTAITVNITGTKPLLWTGAGGADWDQNFTTSWQDTTPAAENFFAGDTVTFDDTVAVPTLVTVQSGVSPWKTTVNSSVNNFTLTSFGNGIAGPGNLEKLGSSTLTLSGTNTYIGKTMIGGGAVSIDGAGALGIGSPGNFVELSGGGRLNYSGTTALDLGINRTIAVGTGGGVLSHSGATNVTMTIPGSLTGSEALGFSSTGTSATVSTATTFALTGNNTGYTGAISVGATSNILATLNLANQAAVPNASSITLNYPAGSITNGNATTLNLPGVTLPVGTTLNMTSFFAGTGNPSLRTQVTSSGNSTINGPITAEGSSIVQFSTANGTLTLNGPITAGGGGFNTANSVFFLRGGGGTGIVNGTITLPGATVSKTDAGTWVINSTGNDWTSSAVAVGTLRTGAAGVLPAALALTLGQNDANAATLDLNGFSQTIGSLASNPATGTNANSKSITSATNATLTVNQATDTTYGSILGGSVVLVKEGAGALALRGANTFTGGTTINSGTLSIAADNNLGAVPATPTVNITLNGGTLREDTGFNMNVNRRIAIGVNGGTFLENATGNFNIQGVIQDAGPGAGALTIAATNTGAYVPVAQNTYSGGTHLTAGSLAIINSASTGSATTNDLVSGPYGTGILYMDGGRQRAPTVVPPVGGWVIGNEVEITADSTFIAGSTNTLTFTGPVTLVGGTRSITQNSAANVIFSGAIGDDANAFGLTLDAASTGRLVLTGVNTYSGGTTIDGGTLNVNADTALGSAAGPLAISNNAVLQAAGTVTTSARTITLGLGGGTIDTAGQLVNLNAGSTVTGTTLNKIGVGVLTLAGTQTYVTLNVDAGGVNLDSALGTGTSTLDVDGAVNISVNQTLANLVIGAGGVVTVGGPALAPEAELGIGFADAGAFDQAGGGFDETAGGGTVEAVPEPGAIGLLMAGALGFLGRRRRSSQL